MDISIKKCVQRTDDEEVARATRLFAAGKITERIWDSLWTEWQDRRRKLQSSLEVIQQLQEYHIANLDSALKIISKVGVLYNKLQRGDQRDLLCQIIERVVVNPEGIVIRLELLLPFSYLRHVIWRVQKGETGVVEGNTKTGVYAGQCSDQVLSGDPDRI